MFGDSVLSLIAAHHAALPETSLGCVGSCRRYRQEWQDCAVQKMCQNSSEVSGSSGMKQPIILSLIITYSLLSMDLLKTEQCSPKNQGMVGGHNVGGACSHNKAFGLYHSPHQREFCTEGLWTDMP